MSVRATQTEQPTRMDRVLNGVERIGNKLPDPFLLFVGLFVLVGLISTGLAIGQVQVTIPGATDPTVIRGLFTGEGLTWFTTNLGANFIGFPPLETVLTILLGVTVAERSGLLSAAIRFTLGRAPRWALPYAVGAVGICGSVMADAAMIIIPPLAAMVFKAAGRHPMAGLIGGFAAANAGYSTAPVVTSLDALFAGITTSVVGTLPNPGAAVTPLANYYFNVVSSVALALLAGFIIDKVIEPRVTRQGVPTDYVDDDPDDQEVGPESADELDQRAPALRRNNTADLNPELDADERRGLVIAAVAGVLLAAAMVVIAVLPASPWRNAEGGFLPESPLLDSVVFIVFALFVVPGIVYGFVARTMLGAGDIPKVMALGIKDMAPFIVLAFVLGQFIALFNWTGVGSALAVSGASGLQAIGMTGLPAIIGFVVLASLLNLFITSGSSMWTLMAAVFVPMFALLGFEPGFIQGAFRVGDSATQVITPMNPYLFVLLMLVRQYEPKAGLGTVISRMLPFVVPFWLVWVAILIVFYFAGWPMGPGVGIRIAG